MYFCVSGEAWVCGLIAWLALWLRMWWLRRKMPRDTAGSTQAPGQGAGQDARRGEVIDAEYTVVSQRDED